MSSAVLEQSPHDIRQSPHGAYRIFGPQDQKPLADVTSLLEAAKASEASFFDPQMMEAAEKRVDILTTFAKSVIRCKYQIKVCLSVNVHVLSDAVFCFINYIYHL